MSMPGYTKLFNSILASTIWREDDKTRIVWITLLAMSDKNGVAECSLPGLADLARVSIEDCKKAIGNLSSPDEYSRTTDNEGRRIEKVDGGWAILNHAKYRSKMSADERREYNRVKQKEFRQKNPSTRRKQKSKMSMTVNDSQRMSALSAHTEAKADTDTSIPPMVPQGGREEGKKDNLPTSEKAIRLATLFGRKPTTEWSDKEIASFKKIAKQPDEDFDLVEQLYRSDYEFLRHDLQTFLNNFTGEVDKARKWKAGKLNGTSRQNAPINPRVAGTANANMCDQYAGFGKVKGASPGNGETSPPSV